MKSGEAPKEKQPEDDHQQCDDKSLLGHGFCSSAAVLALVCETVERKVREHAIACLAVNDEFLDVRQDFFQGFDINPLADDVFGLIVFFQGRQKRFASPWARLSRAWA